MGRMPIQDLTYQQVDPIGGFTARYRIDDKWFINSEADIGG
jgi:hypothetical protein